MSEDLWTLAATELGEEDKAGVDLKPSINVGDILESVERRKQECKDKQWTVSRGGNKNAVVLRDVFTKIAVWINKFMVIGDMAVQYDPAHAALPWALVRFLLKVSVENVHQYAIIAEGVEHVTWALTRYKLVERLYLARSNESTTQLRNGLTKLYTCILRFLIEAQRFYTKSIAHKVTSILSFSSKFSRCIDDINEQEESVKEYFPFVQAEYCGDVERTLDDLSIEEEKNFRNLKGILQELQQPINRMEGDLQALHDGLTIAERGKILQWISPIPYMQHHNQARRDVLAGTGSWFLKDEKVLRWLSSSSSSIMWLHGIAGSGKSKLMSIFVEERLDDAKRESNPCPIYFYCTRNPAERERATPDTILRSFVRQLACSTSDGTILEPVRELYKSREQNGFAAGPLTLDESTALIIELSQDRPLTTIIVDALDECDLSSRGDLLDALSRFLQDSCSLVKILVFSRPDADIVCHFADCLNLQIDASQNQNDIENYVNFEVEYLINRKKLLRGNVPEDLKQTIKTVLRQQAQGSFRWVSLQLQSLCHFIKEDTMRKRLGELPATLRDLYNETYVERLGSYAEDDRQTAEAILRLLMCLREPLTTQNFLLALEFCGKERTSITIEVVLHLCANFVILDTDLDVFRFAHLSVREFLEKKEEFNVSSNHAIAAECCLRYLLNVQPRYEVFTKDGWITEGEEDPSSQHRATFRNLCHEYICLYWPFHLSESSAHRHGPPLEGLFWDFALNDQSFMTCQFVYWVDLMSKLDWKNSLDGWHRDINRLCGHGDVDRLHYGVCIANLMFVASAWNFCEVLQYCFSIDSHVVHLKSSKRRSTPLHLACRYGNVDAAKLLLDNGAEMEITEDTDVTPMMGAIENSHTTIVRLLLEKGINPNSGPSVRYGTNLFLAAERDSIDIVKILLDAGADPDWGGEYAKTALDMAIYNGNLAMVRMILESSGQTNEITNIPWIMAGRLIRAVIDSNEAGVRGMLREWPIAETSARYLNLALWKAALFNQKTSVQLLLAKGADMNSRFRGTPVLYAAACLSHKGLPHERKFPLVQLLLRQGADPNVTEAVTLLHYAVMANKSDLARILLEEGADIDHENNAAPPLLTAVCRGFLESAKVLLQGGVDVERTGFDPDRWQSKRGAVFERPGNPFYSDPDNSPHSALYWARRKEHWEIVQLLLQHGAKDGPASYPHQHEPGSCPYGHGPGDCPHELGRVEDTTDEPEPFEWTENPSDEALLVEREVS